MLLLNFILWIHIDFEMYLLAILSEPIQILKQYFEKILLWRYNGIIYNIHLSLVLVEVPLSNFKKCSWCISITFFSWSSLILSLPIMNHCCSNTFKCYLPSLSKDSDGYRSHLRIWYDIQFIKKEKKESFFSKKKYHILKVKTYVQYWRCLAWVLLYGYIS